MCQSRLNIKPLATAVSFGADTLHVVLADAREITVPLEWFPRLRDATDQLLAKVCIEARGKALRWDELDEDLTVEGILAGRWNP